MESEYQDVTDQEIQDANADIESSIQKLGRERHLVRTFGDAKAAYDDLIEDAGATIERYITTQARHLWQYGKAGGPIEWVSVGHFAESLWLLEDDAGQKLVLENLKGMEYGMDLDEYHAEVAAKRETIALNRSELARRKMERASGEVQTVYADEMSRISGG